MPMPSVDGTGALIASAAALLKVRSVHVLVEAGANLDSMSARNHTPLQRCLSRQVDSDKRLACALILLSAGAKSEPPQDVAYPAGIVQEVRRWLRGFDQAEKCIQKTFDNPTLEKVICEFVYNEPELQRFCA